MERANLRRAIAAGEHINRRDADNAAFDFIRQFRDKLIDGIPVRHCAALAAVADVSESGLLIALQAIARAECLALSYLLGRRDDSQWADNPEGLAIAKALIEGRPLNQPGAMQQHPEEFLYTPDGERITKRNAAGAYIIEDWKMRLPSRRRRRPVPAS